MTEPRTEAGKRLLADGGGADLDWAICDIEAEATAAAEQRLRAKVVALPEQDGDWAQSWVRRTEVLSLIEGSEPAERTWPSRDELEAMSADEMNAFLASRGLDVRVLPAEGEAGPGLREALLRLHHKHTGRGGTAMCDECLHTWPCETFRLVSGGGPATPGPTGATAGETPPDGLPALAATPSPATPSTALDVAWRAAEAALPQKEPDGRYPRDGRYIVLTGPIAGGVYWAYATLFDGNEAQRERRERREPAGFGPIGEGPAAALRNLAARLAPSTMTPEPP